MIKILINGCNGKMGQVLAHEIEITPDVETVCGVDRIDTGDNRFPVFTDVNQIDIPVDVIIDFSVPQATFNILDFAKEKVRQLGGKILFLDFIDEYTELKKWYFKNGFEFKGTVKYEHLPFTVGLAEYYIGE